MTTSAYHPYGNGMIVGHSEVIRQTTEETIAAIIAKRNTDFQNITDALVDGNLTESEYRTNLDRAQQLAEFRAFSAEMNVRESW